MNWEIGTAIAEIASATGIIVTLAYLAYQISQTNRIARSSAVSEMQQKFTDLYALIFADSEAAELMSKLTAPNYRAESGIEEQKLENFAFLLASIWFSSQTSYENGQIDPETYQTYREDVSARLSQWPALKPYLRRVIERYPSTVHRAIFAPVFE